MTTDLYTKSILTIIGIALIALVVQNETRSSYAQPDQLQKVAICGASGLCADVGIVTDWNGQKGQNFKVLGAAISQPINVHLSP